MNPGHLKERVSDPKVVVMALFLVNILIRILYLGSRDIAMDEPFTVFYAQTDLRTLFGMLENENNPPLFFLLLHFWIKLFGISAISVRFLPMLFSAGTAVLVYLTGSRFFSSRVGILASLIFTFSNYHQLFAHEARVYSLFSFLTVLSMYYFLTLVREKSTKTTLPLLITNLLLVFSHFFGFFVLVIQFFCCLVFPGIRKQVLKQYLIVSFLLLVLYSPYFFILVPRFLSTAHTGTWVQEPVVSDLYTMIWRFSNAPVVAVTFIAILAAGLVNWLYNRSREEDQKDTSIWIVATWFFLPYLSMFLISFFLPLFLDRYLVFVSSGFYLLLSIAAEKISKRKTIFVITAVILILLMAATFHPDIDNKRRIRELVTEAKNKRGPGTAILICPSWLDLGFTYHYNQEYFKDYKEYRKKLSGDRIYPINHLSDIDTNSLKLAPHVIYIEEWANLVDKNNAILHYLNNHYDKSATYHFYESFNLHEYSSPKN